MYRAPLFGTLLGSLLLSAACSNDSGAPQMERYPRPGVLAAPTEEPTSYVTGFTFDPEALLMNIVACGPTCPFPPLLLEDSPLFQNSVVRGPVTLLDLAAGAPAALPGVSDKFGTWALPKVKISSALHLPLALGEGAQLGSAPSPVPLANVPPGRYLPTVTLRPVVPNHSQCIAIEALHVSDNGVLEAVAKYLTAVENKPTSVTDFINPTRYSGVNVFWLYTPGFVFLRVPTTPPMSATPPPNPLAVPNTTVKIAQGPASSRILNVQWAPKGDPRLPPEIQALQSARGFFVLPGLESSNVGAVVALHGTATPPGTPILYQPEDKATDDVMFRPWKFPPAAAPVVPGMVTAADLQLSFRDAPAAAGALPHNFCLPAGP